MSRLGAENFIAAGAVWLLIMLPSAAFGGASTADARAHAARMAPASVTVLERMPAF